MLILTLKREPCGLRSLSQACGSWNLTQNMLGLNVIAQFKSPAYLVIWNQYTINHSHVHTLFAIILWLPCLLFLTVIHHVDTLEERISCCHFLPPHYEDYICSLSDINICSTLLPYRLWSLPLHHRAYLLSSFFSATLIISTSFILHIQQHIRFKCHRWCYGLSSVYHLYVIVLNGFEGKYSCHELKLNQQQIFLIRRLSFIPDFRLSNKLDSNNKIQMAITNILNMQTH